MKRLGVIVNPVAGVGGRVGLKGSDGAEVLRRALELGAAREAPRRAQRALERLARLREQIEIVAWPGEMGEVEARAAGWEPTVVGSLAGRRSYVLCELDRTGERPRITCDDFVLTTPEDSQAAARDLLAAGVDLILFAGGDGTARAIRDAVGDAGAGHRRAGRGEDPFGRLRGHAGGRRRPGGAVPPRQAGGGAPARVRGHGHRRGGVPRRPRVGAAVRLPRGALRADAAAERQGRRRRRRRRATWRRSRPTSSTA